MAGDFYGAFDRECLVDDFNSKRAEDYRSVFHQDRDRIMFSPAFRRLQTKTQVFQAGEYDFYRTRLTHSLEVSQIAQSLAIWLRKNHPDVTVELHLLEAICLAHDIGHPPFGHAGERLLQRLMANYGGFEGNAQTLRILTRTIYDRAGGRCGMSPTRALLDGVLKYKRLYRDRCGDTHHFIYDDQAAILDFCFGRHDLGNDFKSLECQIMDLADDIAYSCFDIVDGCKARFITPDELEVRAARSENEVERLHLAQMRDWMSHGKLQPMMNRQVGELIQSASLTRTENFMSPKTQRHAYCLVTTPEARMKIKVQKSISKEFVYGSRLLQQTEYKGGAMLEKLMQAFLDNYLASAKPVALVPGDVHRSVLAVDEKAMKARLLCDYVSGMTDGYALRIYKRLFAPDYGSITELI
jgi:dGTPase